MFEDTSVISGMSGHVRIIVACAIIIAAYLIDFLCCRLLVPLMRRIALRTSYNWDNYLTNGNVLHNVFHTLSLR